MYETEANGMAESAAQIPAGVLDGFSQLHGKVLSRTVLPWGEHCTECVWPTCYTTCDLYSPREDGKCRRFVDGMVRIESSAAVNGYVLKIRFKQWAKLWTPGNLQLHSSEEASRREIRDFRIGSMLYQIPLPRPMKNAITGKRYGWKKRQASRGRRENGKPTSLLLECFNPSDQPIDLSLTIRSSKQGQKIPFQRLFVLKPGFNCIRCPFSEIAATIDFNFPFQAELIPNSFDEETTLYFGLMDFVEEAPVPAASSGKIKCVVWDLDHTVWSGVLVEDGAEKLVLKPEIKSLMETLDQRGILQSVASKNNHEEAMAVLTARGLHEYFLYPQISWGPKGDGLKAIARQLNIAIDSILFVDDQAFEREQVESSCAGVRTMDAGDYRSILAMKECQVPVTEESKSRRKMYQVEQERQGIQDSFKDDYKAFLRDCDIQLIISSLTEENLERVHELAQRTNQMNFSGNRYDREVLREILRSSHFDTYVLRCKDRFGSYGIVGFGVVDKREPRLTDLMFSCRIQSKRVEHAFLRSIIDHYMASMGRNFYANYRKTTKNAPSGKVFEDLGMVETGVSDGVTLLMFPGDKILPDDGIITVQMPESQLAAS
jgi:FkbH-like protein